MLRLLLLTAAACFGQTVVPILPFPSHQPTAWQIAGGTPFNTVVLSATGDRYESCFQAPATGNLYKIGFATRTVTTGDTLRASFQDVDVTTGNADGTQDQYRNITVDSANDNLWFLSGIVSSDGTDGGSLRAVTIRDRLCIVLEYPSYVAGNMQIATINVEGSNKGLPNGIAYNGRYTAGAWTKNTNDGPNFAIQYDSGAYYYIGGVSAFESAASSTFNSGSGFDEAGNRFQYPIAATAVGIWANVNSAADFDLVLYNSGGTALGTATVDKDVVSTTGQKLIYAYFSDVSLTAATTYYVMLKPSSATNAILPYYDLDNSSLLSATIGGDQVYSATRVDAGSFTTTQTRVYAIGVLLKAFTAGGGTTGGAFIIAQ